MRICLIVLMMAAILAACSDKSTVDRIEFEDREGRLAVEGGEIWYKVSGGGTGLPVMLLHGGPGIGSYYMKPLERLGDERRVVRYDQLGAGKSDRVEDTTLFTIGRFVEELEALREHLGYERVHLLGHSWGTILAVEYYRSHPEHVESMVLGSPALNIPVWEENVQRLVETLSDSAREAIRASDATGDYLAPEYQSAMGEFYSRYVMLRPNPDDLDSTFATMNEVIYNYMQGPSEFTITGTLKPYDATSFLRSVAIPTLYTVGEFDEADTSTVRRFAGLTPGSRVEVLKDAAHMTTWDAPDETIRVTRGFLREVDGVVANASR